MPIVMFASVYAENGKGLYIQIGKIASCFE